MIEFRALGGIELRGRSGQAMGDIIVQPMRLALLAYLCIAMPLGFHRRDRLIGLFWPRADVRHARGSLRKNLHALRHSLGLDVLLVRGTEDVAIDPAAIRCDATDLRTALAEERWEDALELYRGELLDAVFITRAPEYERWLEAQRDDLRSGVGRAALRLAERYFGQRAFGPAAEKARRSLGLDPSEPALRLLMQARNEMGDRVGALRAYHAFARYSADEYGIEPSAETHALLERIGGRITSHHQASAIDVERSAGDKAGSIRRQEQEQLSHLDRLS